MDFSFCKQLLRIERIENVERIDELIRNFLIKSIKDNSKKR